MEWTPGYKGRARWTSAWKNTGVGVLKEMLRGKPSTTMRGREFAFAYQHPAQVCEVYEEVGAPMAENIETKRDEISGMSKPGIAGRNQEGDGGISQGNGHSFHD